MNLTDLSEEAFAKATRIPQLTDSDILSWLSLKAKESGIKDCTIMAWLSEYPGCYKNEFNGCFMVHGVTVKGWKSSASCETVEEAFANWKAFNTYNPQTAANELRAEAKELLRKAKELEEGQ